MIAETLFAPYGIDRETGEAFPPHHTQQKVREWVKSVIDKTHKVSGIPCLYLQHGVNSGGTRAILSPVMECLFNYPGMRVLIGRRDYNDLRLSAMETFFEVMPNEMLLPGKDEQEHRYPIRTLDNNSSMAFFRELKDVKGLGSQEFAVIVVHEAHEISEQAFRTLKQRCRQAGFPNMILMEGNPPNEMHWLSEMTNPKSTKYDPDITFWTLTSYENRDHMPEGYLSMLEAMPPSWRKRYLLGETSALPSGTPVYPAFVETVHVQETSIIPDRPIIRGWDWGLRRAACVWGQMEDSGRLLIHREWLAMETPEEQFIDGVILRTNGWFGSRPCRDFGDPAARNRDPNGVSTLQRLQKRNIQLGYRQTTYGERVPLINKKLCEMIQGRAAVVVNPSCKLAIEGFLGGYHYPEVKPEAEFTDRKDVPYKDGILDHIMNATEYMFVNLFGMNKSESSKFILEKRNRIRRDLQEQGSVYF